MGLVFLLGDAYRALVSSRNKKFLLKFFEYDYPELSILKEADAIVNRLEAKKETDAGMEGKR